MHGRTASAASIGFLLALLASASGCGDGQGGDDGPAVSYSIDLSVDGDEPFGALGLDITHLGNNGGFLGRGDKIDCVPLVDAIVAGNYVGERTAKLGLISLRGIPLPSLILRCGFRTSEPLSPASFLIEVTDAANINSEPLDPPPNVAITAIIAR